MIEMAVREDYRIECAIRSYRRPIQRLGLLASLKETAINQDPRLFCMDDVTGTSYFAASGANECDFHLVVIWSLLGN